MFITLTNSKDGIASFSFPKPLICNKNSRLGLSEILFPNCTPQIPASETPYIQIHKYTRESRREKNFHYNETHNIIADKDIFFKNINDLVTFLNNQIKYSGIRFSYLKLIRRIKITFRVLGNVQYRISLAGHINEILGTISSSPNEMFHTTTYGLSPPDIHGNKYHIFLYTPSIKATYIGGISSPLLRLINVNNNTLYTHHMYNHPFYHPMIEGPLYEIQLHVMDQFGKHVLYPQNKYFRITLQFINVN